MVEELKMKAFNIKDGRQLGTKQFPREKKMYKLLAKIPGLLESKSQFRPLRINKRAEKGPDFIAINKKGHLILGELKVGTLAYVAVNQMKRYARRFIKMRQKDLEKQIDKKEYSSLQEAYKNFLPKKARNALLNPSRRRLQLVLVAERFSDNALKEVNRLMPRGKLRKSVKDIKCLKLQLFRSNSAKAIAVGEIISGNKRRLSK
jgi:hypothetical protein